MHALDPRFSRVVVDGATLLLPDDVAWEELDREPMLDGRRLATGGILEHHRVVARKLVGVQVALAEERVAGKPWVVLHVTMIGGRMTRVIVESSSCPACGASHLVGVTRNYDLYVDTEDPLAAVRNHANDALVPCPACGGAFDRPAVLVFVER